MNIERETLARYKKALEHAVINALEVEAQDRASGASEMTIAYDSGRYNGLKQALRALDDAEREA